jgi:hypothetical protein
MSYVVPQVPRAAQSATAFALGYFSSDQPVQEDSGHHWQKGSEGAVGYHTHTANNAEMSSGSSSSSGSSTGGEGGLWELQKLDLVGDRLPLAEQQQQQQQQQEEEVAEGEALMRWQRDDRKRKDSMDKTDVEAFSSKRTRVAESVSVEAGRDLNSSNSISSSTALEIDSSSSSSGHRELVWQTGPAGADKQPISTSKVGATMTRAQSAAAEESGDSAATAATAVGADLGLIASIDPATAAAAAAGAKAARAKAGATAGATGGATASAGATAAGAAGRLPGAQSGSGRNDMRGRRQGNDEQMQYEAGGSRRIRSFAMSMLPKRHDPVLRFFDACPAYKHHERQVERWMVSRGEGGRGGKRGGEGRGEGREEEEDGEEARGGGEGRKG